MKINFIIIVNCIMFLPSIKRTTIDDCQSCRTSPACNKLHAKGETHCCCCTPHCIRTYTAPCRQTNRSSFSSTKAGWWHARLNHHALFSAFSRKRPSSRWTTTLSIVSNALAGSFPFHWSLQAIRAMQLECLDFILQLLNLLLVFIFVHGIKNGRKRELG